MCHGACACCRTRPESVFKSSHSPSSSRPSQAVAYPVQSSVARTCPSQSLAFVDPALHFDIQTYSPIHRRFRRWYTNTPKCMRLRRSRACSNSRGVIVVPIDALEFVEHWPGTEGTNCNRASRGSGPRSFSSSFPLAVVPTDSTLSPEKLQQSVSRLSWRCTRDSTLPTTRSFRKESNNAPPSIHLWRTT